MCGPASPRYSATTATAGYGTAPEPPAGHRRDHVDIHEQRDGLCFVGFAPTVGRLTADSLAVVAKQAAEYGSGRVRTTTEQKMVILDVPPARTADLISELERRLPDFTEPVTINVNGCPNSCARIQTADIGLKGSLVTLPGGQQVEGFQIHLGGSLNGGDGTSSGFGRKVRGLKTTADRLPDYVERILRRFDAARMPGETFATWAARASEEDVS